MEYNNEQGKILKEKGSSGSNSWLWLLALVILGLLIWYGSTQQWFAPSERGIQSSDMDTEIMDYDSDDMDTGMDMGTLAAINSVSIMDSETFPIQKILQVQGDLPNGCTYLNEAQQLRDGNVFYVNLSTRTEGDVCTEALVPYDVKIPLNITNLPSGVYLVNINGREMSFEIAMQNTLDLNAGDGK